MIHLHLSPLPIVIVWFTLVDLDLNKPVWWRRMVIGLKMCVVYPATGISVFQSQDENATERQEASPGPPTGFFINNLPKYYRRTVTDSYGVVLLFIFIYTLIPVCKDRKRPRQGGCIYATRTPATRLAIAARTPET